MKKSSLRAQKMKRTFCGEDNIVSIKLFLSRRSPLQDFLGIHLIGIVKIQDLAATRIDLLMALLTTTHSQSRVHVHVMTSHIQGDQHLEDDRPSWPCGA